MWLKVYETGTWMEVWRMEVFHSRDMCQIMHKIFLRNICRIKKRSYLCIAFRNRGRLAQLVQSICLTSRGSGVRIPQRPQLNSEAAVAEEIRFLKDIPQERGRLAQLVQSICLTSRGSGVRIPQRPRRKVIPVLQCNAGMCFFCYGLSERRRKCIFVSAAKPG